MRSLLTADRSYFVSNAGSDANDGLSWATAWTTPQHAYDTVKRTLDLGNQWTVTINFADGTYPLLIPSGRCVGQDGPENLVLNGNAANSWACIISATNERAIYVKNDAAFTIQGFSLQASIGSNPFSGFGLVVEQGKVCVGPMGWKNCPSGFVDASGNDSFITLTGGQAITTGGAAFIISEAQAQIVGTPGVVVATIGPLNFSLGFLVGDENAVIDVRDINFMQLSGLCTGKQAVSTTQATIAIASAAVPGIGRDTGIAGSQGQII